MEREITKVALVGCGRISEKHFSAINQFSEVLKIEAFCDPEIDKLKNTNKILCQELNKADEARNPIKVFSKYDDLLNEIKCGKLNLELIILCTPSGYHADQAIRAGHLGINVCTEKPIATSLEDGIKLKSLFENNKSNTKLFVVLQNRLNPLIRLLKKQIDNGRFGKIFLISSNVFWQRPQNYYDEAKWRGTKNSMEGQCLIRAVTM